MIDYHVHPDYSMDAKPISIDQYCARAVELNIKHLCFTTHYECDPVRYNLDWYIRINGHMHPMEDWKWVELYLQEIESAEKKYRPLGLEVRSGIEVGYDIGLEQIIEKLITTFPFDFVMGSVHCLEHHAISSSVESGRYFTNKGVQRVFKDYYHVVSQMVDTKMFDCVGHIDLYRRYGLKYLGKEIETIPREYLLPVLKNMASQGIGLEINTSSRRRGHREFHPSGELLNMAIESGVKYFTVGSDAHDLWELGQDIPEAIGMLREKGQGVYVYKDRQPQNITI